MKFRVTSVADESCGARINVATVKLEDWLNATIADSDFGASLDQFMIVVVAVDDDPECNARFAKPWNKLSSTLNPYTGQKVKSLSFSIEVPPSNATEATYEELLSQIAEAVKHKLSIRPQRLPSGFDFQRASRAVSVALEAFA